jgi:hypothetical protein
MRHKLLFCFTIFHVTSVIGSDFGVTGLIDTPNARFMHDGEFKVSFSSQKIANIMNLTYQATPWLETTFRYTIFNPENKNRNSPIIDGANDRSYETKFRLLKEDRYTPAVAIGLRDIFGTGNWGAEYIVASKRVNKFDISLGLGWGRFSERSSLKNPFIAFNDEFKYRESDSKSGGLYGGKLRGTSFFRGNNVGTFGGLTYDLDKYNLKLILEYNSDSYLREIKKGTIENSSPISYGIEWRYDDNVKIGISYQQGNQLGVNISSQVNTKKILKRKPVTPFFSVFDDVSLSRAPNHLNLESWYDRLLYDLERSGILLRRAKISKNKDTAFIEISNMRYELISDALNRTINLAQLHMPRNILKINIIVNENNYHVMTVLIAREQNGNLYAVNSDNKIRLLKPRQIKNPNYKTIYKIPALSINSDIAMKFQLFDPDKPVKNQVYLKLNSLMSLPKDWVLSGSFSLNIGNNFDLVRLSNSVLPHVRTDINHYLYKGKTGIQSLYLEKKAKLNPHTYYRLYLGILEDMYSGAGIELLFNKFKSRIAYGATINSLRKRGYRRNFQLLDYKTTTAYLSLYYASFFYNYDLAIHAGKYLAKDKGTTIEIRRTFDNGFVIGAFSTFTNVSANDFGEGSFDKGFYFKVPFNSFIKLDSKRSLSTVIRSVQRDGGQRLEDFSGRLWHDFRNVRYDSFYNNRSRMLRL